MNKETDLSPLLTGHTRPDELDHLLMRARNGQETQGLQVVMEPTGMAWFPIAVYLIRHDVIVYLVNGKARGRLTPLLQAPREKRSH